MPLPPESKSKTQLIHLCNSNFTFFFVWSQIDSKVRVAVLQEANLFYWLSSFLASVVLVLVAVADSCARSVMPRSRLPCTTWGLIDEKFSYIVGVRSQRGC